MVESTQHKDALIIQIKEAYARITYTNTAHLKLMNRLIAKNKIIKICQIILSAILTVGLIGSMITNGFIITLVSSILSAVLLAINLFYKDFNLFDEIKQHRMVADELWLIREQYVSLLTDACVLTTVDIVSRRDELQNKTYSIYKQSPKTDSKSYIDTQKALKYDEEQFFTPDEIDKMLPSHLRVNNQNSNE